MNLIQMSGKHMKFGTKIDYPKLSSFKLMDLGNLRKIRRQEDLPGMPFLKSNIQSVLNNSATLARI